jgi:hypothetical protein
MARSSLEIQSDKSNLGLCRADKLQAQIQSSETPRRRSRHVYKEHESINILVEEIRQSGLPHVKAEAQTFRFGLSLQHVKPDGHPNLGKVGQAPQPSTCHVQIRG